MDDIANDETVRKKPRQPFSGDAEMAGHSSDFRPFQYEGKHFSDFARGRVITYKHDYHMMYNISGYDMAVDVCVHVVCYD